MTWAARLSVALGYTFAAWVLAATIVYAGTSAAPHALRTAVHCGGVVTAFIPVFRLYFRRPAPLSPGAAAGLAVGFIGLLDLYLIAPYFAHLYDVYLRFWEWQLPAALVAGSIYGTGLSARLQAQRILNQR